MSNAGEGIAHLGVVMSVLGAFVFVGNMIERHEIELNEFFVSVVPNLNTMEWAAVCVACGFLLFLTGLLIDTHGEEFGGDS